MTNNEQQVRFFNILTNLLLLSKVKFECRSEQLRLNTDKSNYAKLDELMAKLNFTTTLKHSGMFNKTIYVKLGTRVTVSANNTTNNEILVKVY